MAGDDFMSGKVDEWLVWRWNAVRLATLTLDRKVNGIGAGLLPVVDW